jgi:acetoin utilization deacetylase AcuC-like enzyme
MHGAKNFPFRKERSTLDVELADGTGDANYLSLLTSHLHRALEESRPDLVFYLAGADPYGDDRFGRLALSLDGLRARDRLVFDGCRRRGLPVVLTLAGGYARSLEDVVAIHCNTVVELQRACA